MSQKSYAYINPKMLKLAREQSGFTIEKAAKSYLMPEKLRRAEEGEIKLTFKQFLQLARKYRRPPAFFYLDEPPKEKLINDFRTLGPKEVKFSPLLRDQIKIIKEKRALAVKFQDYDKKYDYSYINSITINQNPEEVAKKIIKFLKLNMEVRKKWKNEYEALNGWKSEIENVGILIFQISGIDVEEMRGFSISDTPFPTIVINRSDSAFGRIFTLLHELVHIMLNNGGICTLKEKDEVHFKIEKFCNTVAGAILVPKIILKNILLSKEHKSIEWEHSELNSLKRTFWASHEVILRRLLLIKQTTKEFYQKKREYWMSLLKPSKKGYEKQSEKVLRSHSPNSIKIVLNAMNNRNITLQDVTFYLSTSLKHLSDIKNHFTG